MAIYNHAALRAVKIPILALYGGKDLQVPFGLNAPAMRAHRATNLDFRVVVLNGLNHLLQPSTSGSPREYADSETTIAPAALDMFAD